MTDRQPLILQMLFVLLLVSALALLAQDSTRMAQREQVATSTQSAAVPAAAEVPEAAPVRVATSTSPAAPVAQEPEPEKKPIQSQNTEKAPEGNYASRIEDPYPTPPLPFTDINAQTRAALVNIICMPRGGSLHPISGSGVIIDARGVILTNAHVAQYVMLSQSPKINLTCSIRTGAPATARYKAQVLYLPPVWVQEHAADVNADRPLGTGEHDYALLRIAATIDGSPLPASFNAVAPDTREAVAFVGDEVLSASYPAEFAGGSIQSALYPASTITTIDQLFTFRTGSVDVISVGSVIEAQSGSSGGAIVNAWGRLVGLITTTSEGATTADRELRGNSLSYIERDIKTQTGLGIAELLAGNLADTSTEFRKDTIPSLLEVYLPYLQ